MTHHDSDDGAGLTPIDAMDVVFNPKASGEVLDLECPECGEVIQGVSGPGVEYRCGCRKLRQFRVRGDAE